MRIPGVIKLRNGEYTSLNLHLDIEETLRLRGSIIRHTAEIFDPDVFIVDKEPQGLRGEVTDTLTEMKTRGTRLILGLRDVMDEPRLLVPEWRRKKVLPLLRDIYDEIWVFGLEQICNPLAEMNLPGKVERKLVYTGYLPRRVGQAESVQAPEITNRPYILVTPGGGGDGAPLIDWVLRAYESDRLLPYPALLVFGPFMPPEQQAEFIERAAGLENVEAITFDPHMESLMAKAVGVVAMGGYNTFCEILSLDKRALIVPGEWPRLEQTIRAQRAQDLGLAQMLREDPAHDPGIMAEALRNLPTQGRPSEVFVPGLLDGLDNVNHLLAPWLRKDVEAFPVLREGAYS